MNYRIVNLGTGILGPRPAPPARGLGQDTEAVRKARALYERVQASYQNLVSLLGKAKADLAVEQAKKNLEKAEIAQ